MVNGISKIPAETGKKQRNDAEMRKDTHGWCSEKHWSGVLVPLQILLLIAIYQQDKDQRH